MSSDTQDKATKIIRTMVAHAENRFCFDCHQRGPTYVNMTIGSFVCTSCGGALRKYNHRIKSISMCNFSTNELEFLYKRGNKACRLIYLAVNDPTSDRTFDEVARESHLRQKYQQKLWYSQPTAEVEEAAVRENRQFLASREGDPATYSTQTNSIIHHPTTGRQPPATRNDSHTSSTSKNILPNGGTTATRPASTQSTPSPKVPATTDIFAFFSDHAQSTSVTTTFPSTDLFASFPVNSAIAPPISQSSALTPLPDQQSKNPTWSNQPVVMDKYAALAELDGLFKSSVTTMTTTSPHPFISASVAPQYSVAAPTHHNPFASAQPTGTIRQYSPSNPFVSHMSNLQKNAFFPPSSPPHMSAIPSQQRLPTPTYCNPFTSVIPHQNVSTIPPMNPFHTTFPVNSTSVRPLANIPSYNAPSIPPTNVSNQTKRSDQFSPDSFDLNLNM